ncbi:MAG: 16S rRNA (cytosine(1402)-N(4))-methyltransferase RsmH [Verrucomicrobiae bacterium]|nr:16S rRNA (cytosine(1402)-N(4))-methyltransferase RsmH [Verrucomicrobiae bacterium]
MGPTDGGKGASARSGGGEEISPERQAARAKSDYHLPVLMDEVLTALRPGSEKWIFDGTLGGGGHSEALLRAGASVIACDQDLEAIVYASARLAVFGERFSAVHANFGSIDRILSESGVGAVDGILLDLGVSSRHLDAAERGFSFQKDGPLDMRMNFTEGRSAADLVNEEDEAELARIFWEFGEERASRKIARAIVTAREKQPFTRTLELAGLIASVLPRGGAKHPATRVFQALRIAVNEELVRLNEALAKSIDCLKPGGALAVITFHSLEDRIVKQFMRRHSEKTIDRPEWPAPKPNPEYFFDLPGRKPIAPSVEEQKANPRARSAKLRVAVRV